MVLSFATIVGPGAMLCCTTMARAGAMLCCAFMAGVGASQTCIMRRACSSSSLWAKYALLPFLLGCQLSLVQWSRRPHLRLVSLCWLSLAAAQSMPAFCTLLTRWLSSLLCVATAGLEELALLIQQRLR